MVFAYLFELAKIIVDLKAVLRLIELILIIQKWS